MGPVARMRTPAESREVQLYGVRFRYRVDGDESGGTVAVVEVEIPPRTLVKPHEHSREDEYTLVLEGTVGARIGDDTADLGPGSSLVKPRNVPHALWNAGSGSARIVEILAPAGFEQYFMELAPVLARKGDTASYDALGERYGIRIIDDWVPLLEERYGVKL